MSSCAHVRHPLSWLTMEQYHLGELSQSERESVRAHLEYCGECSAHVDSIVTDPYVLKPLPEIPERSSTLGWPSWSWALTGGLGAVAAALILMFIIGPQMPSPRSFPNRTLSYKGGDLAITVARERDGIVTMNPEIYVDGDRFSINVTCPLVGTVPIDIAVFQDNQVLFPYDEGLEIECGNTVSIPGAFILTGNLDTIICVSVDDVPSRFQLEQDGTAALTEGTVCLPIKGYDGE